MRIGHLIEQHDGAIRVGIGDDVGKIAIFQCRAFQHQPLMRRIARNQPVEIGPLGVFDREIRRQFAIERGYAFACGP